MSEALPTGLPNIVWRSYNSESVDKLHSDIKQQLTEQLVHFQSAWSSDHKDAEHGAIARHLAAASACTFYTEQTQQ